ncbi:hypothetical protein NUK47_16815 [Aeromonas hydrophila]|uniref:DUF6602 domain-containing protein n=2 Tax=Aeromonadaceae TaxID=84642 RepID=UPI00214DE121|nr:DUF6602 domain-containing protein [Aeromonas hydrophila]MCR3910435.1 hypothetical protein [Aeromonas hydrophila]
MAIISKKINEKINYLKGGFEVNKDIFHNGIKGGLNEGELSSLIKDVIPQRYRITRGIIENAINEQSNETDIIIYDDEILPPYIKNDLSFVPVEAVKYAFEVKTKLNANELRTTLGKFTNFKTIGGSSPTVLFSFSTDIKGSELLRYYNMENKKDFFVNPSITVLCTSNKSYYYKTSEELYLKDFISNRKWFEMCQSSMSDLKVEDVAEILRGMILDEQTLSKMGRVEFAALIQAVLALNNHTRSLESNDVCVNGIKYSDVKFTIHKWIGIECDSEHISNNVELSFLSGISNTLSKSSLGKYLLSDLKLDVKLFSICFEDMWGNISCQDFNENGISYPINEYSFDYRSDSQNHKMVFKIKK